MAEEKNKTDDYTGKTIGGYRVIGEIGRGANGVVCKAEQLSLGRMVALKILFSDKSGDREYMERFFREARAGAKLCSEYVVQIYDLGVTEDKILYFAMELVEGETAEDYLFREKQLPERTVWEIASAVAGGLYYAYAGMKFVHGDLKPANVLIRKSDGAIKLADLGLAKLENQKNFSDIMATPAYAPPELVRGEIDKFGLKTDLYSFGVMLFELLSGKVPFEGKMDDVLKMHLETPPPDILERRSDISPAWRDFIFALLAKDPEERPQNWGEVLDYLQSFEAELQ